MNSVIWDVGPGTSAQLSGLDARPNKCATPQNVAKQHFSNNLSREPSGLLSRPLILRRTSYTKLETIVGEHGYARVRVCDRLGTSWPQILI